VDGCQVQTLCLMGFVVLEPNRKNNEETFRRLSCLWVLRYFYSLFQLLFSQELYHFRRKECKFVQVFPGAKRCDTIKKFRI